jgi:hypothetical protein
MTQNLFKFRYTSFLYQLSLNSNDHIFICPSKLLQFIILNNCIHNKLSCLFLIINANRNPFFIQKTTENQVQKLTSIVEMLNKNHNYNKNQITFSIITCNCYLYQKSLNLITESLLSDGNEREKLKSTLFLLEKISNEN